MKTNRVKRWTLGPWSVSGPNRLDTYAFGVQSTVWPNKYHVCDVCDDIDPVEYDANAALISAAPDLVEALEMMLEMFGDCAAQDMSYTSAIDSAESALAKAYNDQ